MEILMGLLRTQDNLEDALRMEIDYEDVNDTKEGKHLLRWLRKRRKMIERFVRWLENIL
jgi:hypothetical protein